MPQSPKPPTSKVLPLGISFTASDALDQIFPPEERLPTEREYRDDVDTGEKNNRLDILIFVDADVIVQDILIFVDADSDSRIFPVVSVQGPLVSIFLGKIPIYFFRGP